jgi:hypothetical protein
MGALHAQGHDPVPNKCATNGVFLGTVPPTAVFQVHAACSGPIVGCMVPSAVDTQLLPS